MVQKRLDLINQLEPKYKDLKYLQTNMISISEMMENINKTVAESDKFSVC